jgi:signal transduction histidine kinase
MQLTQTEYAGGDVPLSGKWEIRWKSVLRPLGEDKRFWPVAGSLGLVVLFFIADTLLPRGATPAIGYGVVPLLAVRARRRGFLAEMTAFCSVLIWVGYFLEPAGAPLWMSIFDRAMVTGSMWLSAFLVWRRAAVVWAMREQAINLDKLARELARSNEDLESFASVAAHDLRGPLSAAFMTVELLANPGSGDTAAERLQWITSLQSELNRMSSLIQSLLIYGRASAGPLEPAVCDCESILSAVLENLAADLQRNQAEVTHDPLPTVMAHSTLLSQLFQNLVENAVKYHGDKTPRVHIHAERGEKDWSFSVRDNGIGIHPRDAQHIFEPFRRARTDGVKRPGSGIGLATCKRIVERHGGRIWVESVPGQGATFCFTLSNCRVEATRA